MKYQNLQVSGPGKVTTVYFIHTLDLPFPISLKASLHVTDIGAKFEFEDKILFIPAANIACVVENWGES